MQICEEILPIISDISITILTNDISISWDPRVGANSFKTYRSANPDLDILKWK